ncbi:uncharacterized protein EI97DRAFT_223978 [Westerdykella ornata]|uniref:Uncharacterized protein n=1 Tax=Westerdykella ornata TaxID=318751 RepID=A0A6A6JRR8_WESOR|nr:uncharacterized protein EI97DRAFT_223978 [Westerdykella ornata]KAF2278945.1 hypothetical protein EI97DRAFT_223978 [Westerdykella ornata]
MSFGNANGYGWLLGDAELLDSNNPDNLFLPLGSMSPLPSTDEQHDFSSTQAQRSESSTREVGYQDLRSPQPRTLGHTSSTCRFPPLTFRAPSRTDAALDQGGNTHRPTQQTHLTGPPKRRPFQCPIFQMEMLLGQPRRCTGGRGDNMAAIRRHIERSHNTFVKLCSTCNENILDEAKFYEKHGQKGELCTGPPRSQAKGAAAEAQWTELCGALFPEAKEFPSPYAAPVPSPKPHQSPSRGQTGAHPRQSVTESLGNIHSEQAPHGSQLSVDRTSIQYPKLIYQAPDAQYIPDYHSISNNRSAVLGPSCNKSWPYADVPNTQRYLGPPRYTGKEFEDGLGNESSRLIFPVRQPSPAE